MFKIENLESRSFDWETSLSLASASKLSYYAPKEAAAQTDAWGFKQFDFVEKDATQVVIAQSEKVLLIAFRGTDSTADWIGNFDFWPRDHPLGGQVHDGFMRAFDVVRAPILKYIASAGQRLVWLTGHSLGGVVASLAAAEADPSRIAGIQTFGQPRLSRGGFRAAFGNRFRGCFFRFVNDDDIVPRVPPILEHVGALIHLQSPTSWTETVTPALEGPGDPEPPPLTEAQFKALQSEIQAVKAERKVGEAAALEGAESSLDATIEGFFPSFADHRIGAYIAAIQRRIATPSPLVAAFESAFEISGPESAGAVASPPMAALLRIRTPNWSPPDGVNVLAQFGSIYSVLGPRDRIWNLAGDPDVASIEQSRETGLPELVHSVPFVGGNVVQSPPIDERGDRALIGFIDTGIDVLHEAFRDADDRTRILAIWDQGNAAGPTPFSVDPAAFPNQNFGTLYLKPDIDLILTRWRTTKQAPPPRLRDPQRHGTHVASIAAGRAVGTLGTGMAPEARLLLVIASTRGGASLGYSTSHTAALNFLVRAPGVPAICADRLPLVINVSLGMNAGAHDGSSLLEASFDGATGGGRDPGIVVVKSAGNERGRGGHTRVQAPVLGTLTDIGWTASSDTDPQVALRGRDYLEFWFSSWLDLEFVLKDPAGNRSPAVNASGPRVQVNLGGNDCVLELLTSHPDNGDSRLVVTIEKSQGGSRIQAGLWNLEIARLTLSGVDLTVDGWIERDDARALSFTVDEDDTTLSIPGTAKTVIAVAACSTDLRPRTVPSSSYGPDRKGRPKPEIAAPGQSIIAARANDPDTQATMAETGTSMAAPHVAGAIALALSQRAKQAGRPQLSANQIAWALTRSAKGASGSHTNSFGYGVLNVVDFLSNAARI